MHTPALCHQDRSLRPRQMISVSTITAVELGTRTCALTMSCHSQVPTSQMELSGVHGISAYLPAELDARRDLPVVVGDVFAALLAEPTLRHVWLRFDGCRASPVTMRCASALASAHTSNLHTGVSIGRVRDSGSAAFVLRCCLAALH